jgi:Acetyltransferase (GNAT) domain
MADSNNITVEFSTFDFRQKLDEQRALFAECFPETAGTPAATDAHYHWKFQSFVNQKNSFEYGAFLQGEMIGYYAAIPYTYLWQNKQYNVAMVCDVMTGIKARGKGVFTKLGIYATRAMAEGGADFTTGYPIRPEVIPGHIKAGWDVVFDMPMYGRFTRLNAFLTTKRLAFLAPVGNAALFVVNNLFSLTTSAGSRVKISRYVPADIGNINGWDQLMQCWQQQIPVSLSKTNEFLKWRLGAPGTSYTISVLSNGDEVAGYAITTQVTKEGVPCLAILDFFVKESLLSLAPVLTKSLVRLANENGCELIIGMMHKRIYQRYKLFRNGFIRTPHVFKLILKKLSDRYDYEKLKDPENWHLMWIDSDDL